MTERRFLVLRLDAPLMSFGGIAVDEHGVTQDFPPRSLVAGLLGNALGFDHRDAHHLQRIQERIRLGVRRDRKGERLVDFQTVDLSQSFLAETWTTHDEPAARAGGTAREATHIRFRHYWADAVFTLVLTMEPEDEIPTLHTIAEALQQPERPLFIGRKPCIPAAPLLVTETVATTLPDALLQVPLSDRADRGNLLTWWPMDDGAPPTDNKGRQIAVTDDRDWANQVHVGRRLIWETVIPASEVIHGK